MKIAIIQLDIAWENKEKNLERAQFFVSKAKDDQCDLVIFPEMFNTGFSMNTQSTSEPANGATQSKIVMLARQYKINIIVGFAVEDEPLTRNTAVLINHDGIVEKQYTKNYPFSFASEDKHYQSSNNQVILDIDNVKASLFICYDLRFPELFRKVAKQVDMIFVIANWPTKRKDHWQTLLKARAIENQCFIIGVNRIGEDGNGLSYPGLSTIINPWGEIILTGSDTQEYLSAEIESSDTKRIRTQFPFLADMKI